MTKGIPEQFDIMVTAACNARCPFCVQEVTFKPLGKDDTRFKDGLIRHFADFYAHGGRRVVITGGEPTTVPERVFASLEVLRQYPDLEVVALYTNGSKLMSVAAGESRTYAQRFAEAGLPCVNLSVHDFDLASNRAIFALPNLPPTDDITRHLRDCGLAFRFNLTLHQGGVETYDDFLKYVDWAFAQGAQDVYVRDLFEFGFDKALCKSDREALEFMKTHRVDVAALVEGMRTHAEVFEVAYVRDEIVREKREHAYIHRTTGKKVFLAQLKIGTESRDAIPYLIYMPDGNLYRGWLGEPDRMESIR